MDSYAPGVSWEARPERGASVRHGPARGEPGQASVPAVLVHVADREVRARHACVRITFMCLTVPLPPSRPFRPSATFVTVPHIIENCACARLPPTLAFALGDTQGADALGVRSDAVPGPRRREGALTPGRVPDEPVALSW